MASSQGIEGNYNAQNKGSGNANVNSLTVNLIPNVLPRLGDLALLQNGDSKALTDVGYASLRPLWMTPYERNRFFTGREDVLTNLRYALMTDNVSALTQPQAISGLGGMGKTQIAVEYAYRYQHTYEHILWLKADSYETLVSDFVTLAHLLQLSREQDYDPQHIIQLVKHWLSDHTGWLLIFDNADDLAMIRDFLPVGGRGHILITTCSFITGTIAQRVQVERMDDKEAILFLLHRAKILDFQSPLASVSDSDHDLALQITQELEGLPLALDQAGAYIEETGCSLADYLDLFRTRQAELLRRRGTLITDHPDAVTTTLSLSFEKVQQANPAAADIMRLFAFLNPTAVPEGILKKGCSAFGSVLQKVINDPLALNEAISTLLSYSFVRRNHDHTLTVHRLVQAVLKHSMNQKTQRLWAERTIRAVQLAFPEVDYANWQSCQQYLPQVQSSAVLIDQWRLIFPEAANLLMEAGTYLYQCAHYEQAESFYQRALAIREKVLGSEHSDTATCLHSLAHLYQDQGKYEQAEAFHLRELAICEKALGPEHPDTAASLRCLACLYQKQGKYEQAESFYQRALAIREKVLGFEHSDTATCLHSLACLYQEQGKYEQAETFFLRALAVYEEVLGSKHSRVGITLHNLAYLYQEQSKYEQAESFCQRALMIHEKVLGQEHPDTAVSLRCLGDVYREQDKYGQAESFYLRALAISEKVLGCEHPDTAGSLHDLAHLYQDQGKYEQAEAFHLRELAIREKVLGPNHPNTGGSLLCLGNLYREQDKYGQAESFYLRSLLISEQGLGPEHFNTAIVLHSLAHLYQDQGKYEQAEAFHLRELAIREKVLGPNHPDTAASLHCLAHLYQEQGKYEQAKSFYQHALAIRKKALGSQHPDTAVTLAYLDRLFSMKSKARQKRRHDLASIWLEYP